MQYKNRKKQERIPSKKSTPEEKFGSKTKIEPMLKPIIQKKVGA